MAKGIQIDPFPSVKMANRMEEVGSTKITPNIGVLSVLKTLVGSLCARAISCIGCEIVNLLAGLLFYLSLITVTGVELLTDNTSIVMTFASGKISPPQLRSSWGIVYVRSFMGSILPLSSCF